MKLRFKYPVLRLVPLAWLLTNYGCDLAPKSCIGRLRA
jgi:hypothetical protein